MVLSRGSAAECRDAVVALGGARLLAVSLLPEPRRRPALDARVSKKRKKEKNESGRQVGSGVCAARCSRVATRRVCAAARWPRARRRRAAEFDFLRGVSTVGIQKLGVSLRVSALQFYVRRLERRGLGFVGLDDVLDGSSALRFFLSLEPKDTRIVRISSQRRPLEREMPRLAQKNGESRRACHMRWRQVARSSRSRRDSGPRALTASSDPTDGALDVNFQISKIPQSFQAPDI